MSTKSKSKTAPKSQSSSMLWIWAGLAAVVLIAIAVFFFTRSNSESSRLTSAKLPNEVSIQEAAALHTKGAYILDVRQPEEWQEYHIPDSTLIPLGELPNRLNEIPKDKEIVVVCRSGNRSQQGRDILLNAGFSPVTSMAGGLKEWLSSGHETISGP
jgi:rhodanese-related sulfurtransferase